jgi:hypothetical protein
MWRPIFVLLPLVLGCGSGGKGIPLVEPGSGRSQAEANLKSENYCRDKGAYKRKQNYVRCGVVGFEVGERWVVVDYDKDDQVERVRRMEHYPDHKEATKRFNTLVELNNQRFGSQSEEARERLLALGETPGGAVLWMTWMTPSGNLVGLYLVKPDDEKSPRIVEVSRTATKATEK